MLEDKSVILMPFCVEAVFLYHKLKKKDIDVVAFFDNKIQFSDKDKEYKSVSILPPHATDYKVVLCTEKYFDVMREQLNQFGYAAEDVLDFRELDLGISDEEIVDEIDEIQYTNIATFEALYANDIGLDKNGIVRIREARRQKYAADFFVVDSLDIKLTDRCTLKCKYCAASIDYLSHDDQCDNDVDQVFEDFISFLDKVDFVRRVFLTGGESFLYKDLEKLLSYMIDKNDIISKKCGIVTIITNGTVMPSEQVVDLIKKNNIFVLISDYLAVKAIKRNKMTQLVRILTKGGTVFNYKFRKWVA
jgi:hypothetical protein